MFNFGWGELVVIGIVALIAIGPKELPTVLRTIGHWMGKVRRMASEFQGQFNEALREAELTDLKKQAEDLTTDISNFDPMADTQKEMEQAFATDPMAEPPVAAETATTAEPAAAPLPEIDVPMPEMPAPVTEKDFAPQEAAAAQAAVAAQETVATKEPPPDKPKKQAGGSA